jgi:penicillin amidase
MPGAQLFNQLNPRFTDNEPTTIPAEDWSVPVPDNLVATPQAMLAPANYPVFKAAITTGFSNVFVLGKDKVEAANSTWAGGDIVDIYAEQLNPENPEQYWYKGGYRELQHRTEVIKVRGAESIRLEVYRSVHGPVILQVPGVNRAYTKHRAWDGGELDTLLAWIAATHADDFESWKVEAAKSAINVNMYFADVHGNIGYFFGGQYPQRAAGHDNRFPVTGDGSMDWIARMPIEQANPHVKNPGSNFIANWNNKPGQGVMNPDFFFYSWSAADRIDILHDALNSQDTFTPDEAWGILTTSSYADVHAPYLLPLIDSAVQEQGSEQLIEVNEILQNWNRQSTDSDQDGNYDEAATAILRTFAGVLLENVLADDLGDVFAPFSGVGYPTAESPTGAGTNIQAGMKAVFESLSGRGSYDLLNGEATSTVIVKALSETLDLLAAEQGGDVSAYRLPVATRPFSYKNFLGIPQAGSDELRVAPIEQNRGTENNMIVMRENAIVGWEVTPPGQNAFVGPDGETGPHYDDQFEMYQNFGRKRMWFYTGDVQANKVSEEIINYVR